MVQLHEKYCLVVRYLTELTYHNFVDALAAPTTDVHSQHTRRGRRGDVKPGKNTKTLTKERINHDSPGIDGVARRFNLVRVRYQIVGIVIRRMRVDSFTVVLSRHFETAE